MTSLLTQQIFLTAQRPINTPLVNSTLQNNNPPQQPCFAQHSFGPQLVVSPNQQQRLQQHARHQNVSTPQRPHNPHSQNQHNNHKHRQRKVHRVHYLGKTLNCSARALHNPKHQQQVVPIRWLVRSTGLKVLNRLGMAISNAQVAVMISKYSFWPFSLSNSAHLQVTYITTTEQRINNRIKGFNLYCLFD